MSDLPINLYFAKDVQKIDALAIANIPINGYQLMLRAAQAAFIVLQQHWENAKTIAVVCGGGKNGGDGYVLAKLAKKAGLSVTVYSVGEAPSKALEAKQAHADWLAIGEKVIPFQNQQIFADVIVDAILGTGTHFPLPQEISQAISAINNSHCPVFSLDLPSGLDANTGHCEEAVKATLTLTFIAMKVGLLTGKAADLVGKLVFDNLGVTASIYSQVKPCARRIDYQEECSALVPRSLSQNKGDNGHVCLIGAGQSGFSGAISLSSEAALRAGAGKASAVVSPESLMLLARSPSEVMCYGFSSPKEAHDLVQAASVIVLGPGLSQNAWGEKWFEAFIKVDKPMVVDADGLNWLAKKPQKRDNWILTPHPGEAARLLGKTTQDVQQDRIKAAHLLKEKYGGVIVLKGAGTIVVTQEGEMAINATANPILATAGTGDVLSGLIGGLLAQNLSLSHAATLGVSVHAMAADLEATMGTRGMLASDLFLHIRNLLNPQAMS